MCFGGADVFNLSTKFSNLIRKIDSSIEINLLVGDAFAHQVDLLKNGNINIFKNLSAKEVSLLMAKSEVCIVPLVA